MIKGRPQLAFKEAPDSVVKNRLGAQSACHTKAVEPAQPSGHMTDLVAVDTVQDLGTLGISDPLEPRRHLWGHVEPARLEHQRDDGETRAQVAGSRGSGFPEPVMSRQIAVVRPKLGQPARQQLKVAGLLGGHIDPVVEKPARQSQADEPGDKIPSEINSIELDMGEDVKERDTAGWRAEGPAFRHFPGRAQQWASRPGRAQWRHRSAERNRAFAPRRSEHKARRCFGGRVGGGEDRHRLAG